ncbi:hypothetical protein ACWEQC_04240 [Streptomyces shenzhenensis]
MTLLEILVGLLLAAAVGRAVIAVIARKARRRDEELGASGKTEIPCRLNWPERIGRNGARYGKLIVTDSSATFRTPTGKTFSLPAGCTPYVKPSWRTGNVTIECRNPEGTIIVILVSEADSAIVVSAITRIGK